MLRRRWCSFTMSPKIFAAAFVIQYVLGQNDFDAIKRQSLIPTARIGREIFLTDEDMPFVLYPNVEESLELSSVDPEYFDAEIAREADSNNEVSRKKRSASEEQSKTEKVTSDKDNSIRTMWNQGETDLLKADKRKSRAKALFIPRVGKKNYDETENDDAKRALFIPRIGKKSFEDGDDYEAKRAMFIPRIGKKNFDENDYYSENKRAVFIPRIGKRSYDDVDYPEVKRAFFIPRVGRSSYDDVDYPEVKRAFFIPRVGKRSYENVIHSEGKRAIFIPRIGRTSFIPSIPRYVSKPKTIGRAVFIPRIG